MMVAYGFSFAQSGFALPQLEDPAEEFSITKEEGSWFASILIIGGTIGSMVGSIQSKVLGRRKSIWVNSLFFIIINSVLASTSNVMVLLATRLLLGIVLLSSVVSLLMYCGEITQPKVRKITGVFPGISFAFGSVFGLTFGAILNWRWAFAIGNLIPLFR